MIINSVQLKDLDIYDVEIAEKYEKALKNIEGIEKKVKDLNFVEGIRTQCNAIFDVFNTLFGEGTAEKVFGNKVNLLTCLKAFEELVIQINEQKQEIESMASKYTPNRAKRRKK